MPSLPTLTGAIELPDGTWVRGRGLRHPRPDGRSPDFGLYLGSPRLRRRHDDALTWARQWIDWPDFGLPRDRDEAIRHIRALHERAQPAGSAVEVACGGGVGRTGTVIACLAVLTGLDPATAIAWTREHLHPRAVETPWQRRWVATFRLSQTDAGQDR
ncbi:protein tyrosine phosphatase [Frankia sp. CcI49]|uniref:phosphatase domain-containing protein n=1 Tax=unclassified Frankia TaxID=2632575 RepID=UPI0006CA2BE3|nr:MULTISPECIES: protein-tyrosine phosphatase family protein [unclassified Frankia]KPM53532.1 protein tyrosine phosphatase [Frankia sp. R43]ONH54877.1 protein tyrosine phosphatase [Frankia sp. CcI49]